MCPSYTLPPPWSPHVNVVFLPWTTRAADKRCRWDRAPEHTMSGQPRHYPPVHPTTCLSSSHICTYPNIKKGEDVVNDRGSRTYGTVPGANFSGSSPVTAVDWMERTVLCTHVVLHMETRCHQPIGKFKGICHVFFFFLSFFFFVEICWRKG